MGKEYEKRRFVEATSVALFCASIVSNVPMKSPKQAVNIAGELWDELEHQYPTKDEDR